jgi:DNA topoisomerase-1
VFASLPRATDPDTLLLEQAVLLLTAQRQKGKGQKRKSRRSAAAPAKSPRIAKPAGTRDRATAGASKKPGAKKSRARSSAQPR